jgi:hypothetical protein
MFSVPPLVEFDAGLRVALRLCASALALGIYRSASRRPLAGWSLGPLCSYESHYSFNPVGGIQTLPFLRKTI